MEWVLYIYNWGINKIHCNVDSYRLTSVIIRDVYLQWWLILHWIRCHTRLLIIPNMYQLMYSHCHSCWDIRTRNVYSHGMNHVPARGKYHWYYDQCLHNSMDLNMYSILIGSLMPDSLSSNLIIGTNRIHSIWSYPLRLKGILDMPYSLMWLRMTCRDIRIGNWRRYHSLIIRMT